MIYMTIHEREKISSLYKSGEILQDISTPLKLLNFSEDHKII